MAYSTSADRKALQTYQKKIKMLEKKLSKKNSSASQKALRKEIARLRAQSKKVKIRLSKVSKHGPYKSDVQIVLDKNQKQEMLEFDQLTLDMIDDVAVGLAGDITFESVDRLPEASPDITDIDPPAPPVSRDLPTPTNTPSVKPPTGDAKPPVNRPVTATGGKSGKGGSGGGQKPKDTNPRPRQQRRTPTTESELISYLRELMVASISDNVYDNLRVVYFPDDRITVTFFMNMPENDKYFSFEKPDAKITFDV